MTPHQTSAQPVLVEETCECGDYRRQHPNDGPSELAWMDHPQLRCTGYRPQGGENA